jgi:Flp pilus assembly protein TadB
VNEFLEDERIKTRLEIEKYIQDVDKRRDEALSLLREEVRADIKRAIDTHTKQAIWISLVAGFWLVVVLLLFLL